MSAEEEVRKVKVKSGMPKSILVGGAMAMVVGLYVRLHASSGPSCDDVGKHLADLKTAEDHLDAESYRAFRDAMKSGCIDDKHSDSVRHCEASATHFGEALLCGLDAQCDKTGEKVPCAVARCMRRTGRDIGYCGDQAYEEVNGHAPPWKVK